jgi:hypothetical protein
MGRASKKRSNRLFLPFTAQREKRKQEWDWAKFFTLVASVVGGATVFLALLGFGVALSAEIRLSLPHASVFSSTSELIALSTIAISQYLVVVSSSGPVHELVRSSFLAATPSAIAVFVLWLVLCVFHQPLSSVGKHWQTRANAMIRAPRNGTSKLRWFGEAVMLSLLALIIQPLAALGWLLLSVAFIIVIAVPVMIGEAAAGSYIQKYVVLPKHCAGEILANAASRDLATCVTIRTKDFGAFSGRLVFATSSIAVLYDAAQPGPVKIKRVPISDAIIESTVRLPLAPDK